MVVEFAYSLKITYPQLNKKMICNHNLLETITISPHSEKVIIGSICNGY